MPPQLKPPFTTHVVSYISLLFDLPASTSVPLSSQQLQLLRSLCSPMTFYPGMKPVLPIFVLKALRVCISAWFWQPPHCSRGYSLNGLCSGPQELKLLLFSVCFVIVACLSKIFGCGGVARLCKFKGNDALKIGVGMMTRGEVALITASKGLAAGLITEDFFTAVILLILVSSITVPILLKSMFKKYPAD